ncbi:MAG: hypothetical protein OXH30_15140 [Chloroflexi bacterium]|nr:hypothetical protein [Chloroflexota bacterium]
MPRKRKERGRPMERTYPPRIDVAPEAMAKMLFSAGPVTGPVSGRDYHCADCGEKVIYPAILYSDNRCEACHQAGTD